MGTLEKGSEWRPVQGPRSAGGAGIGQSEITEAPRSSADGSALSLASCSVSVWEPSGAVVRSLRDITDSISVDEGSASKIS